MTTKQLAAEAEWLRWHAATKAGTGDLCPTCGAMDVWPTREGVACRVCGWEGK